MNKFIVLAFILGLFSSSVEAQQSAGSGELTILTQNDLMINSVLSNASLVSVAELKAYQSGNGNQQRISPQNGENNIRLIQQGDFNTMDLQLQGEGNNYQFSQLGNGNDLQLRNLQTNNNTLQIVQRGNGNQLIDNGSGLLSRPIRIEQSGGMKVLINGQ